MLDLGNFVGALACFVAELIVFGVIVTFFVMGHFRLAWTASTLTPTTNRSPNRVTATHLKNA